MYEVQPNLLWLGHSFDLREPQLLFDVGIAAVIDLAIEQPPAQLPRTLIYCRFPIHDGGGNDAHVLVQSVQTLVDLLAGGTPTLAVCGAGMSRAPTIVAHALALHLGQKPEEVLLRIREDRSLEIKATLWDDVSSLLPRIRSGTLQT